MNKKDTALYREKVLKPVAEEKARRWRASKPPKRGAARKKRVAKKKKVQLPNVKLSKNNRRTIAIAMSGAPNNTVAAERAGVAKATIDRADNDPQVRAYIEEIQEEAAQEAVITQAEVLRELKRVALQNAARFVRRVGDQLVVDFSRVKYADMAVIQEFSCEEVHRLDNKGRGVREVYSRIKQGGKLQALDMLCKYFRIYGADPAGGGVPGLGAAAQAPALNVQFVEPAKKLKGAEHD